MCPSYCMTESTLKGAVCKSVAKTGTVITIKLLVYPPPYPRIQHFFLSDMFVSASIILFVLSSYLNRL